MNQMLLAIPKSVENLQLPDPELRNQYYDEENRVFYIEGEINGSGEDGIPCNLIDINKMILRINKEDKDLLPQERKPIILMIDSVGGNLIGTYSLMELIKISKTPIYTVNMCQAFSAAGLILACGHRRFAFPGTSVLIHSGSRYYGGTQEQAESLKKYIDKLDKKAVDLFMSHTKIESKTYRKKSPTDWYLDESEALEMGIIDKVITDIDEIL